ncbi:hypothetical protein [Epilithonimonas lactis]|uniref:Uncharacterized protein n=1 Tax=Epilithonimonas lactis TaxID=421072 RepID=A0A085BHW1_9FLAO|nr:hypothetical protein [Epilithonimonas lactis]KFC22056.1 hypothetical protein IO89_08830 [Epilithonimonas lactis]SEQ53087.1 hypothetical protein SAMN04488097_2380 [Epilithonimonas lactis]
MLKFNFRFLFLIGFPLNIFGQTENINSGKYHPAKEIFESNYQKQEFARFPKNQIRIENDTVFLGEIKSIKFDEHSNETTKLFCVMVYLTHI